ncbi:hypothetical protein EHP00_1790 [Ecytonucleospora hepatopenaei]|uniref:Uncharacterized protein n=1 Tax=Ecytonucleospora hepatopenaei TaxID=646526 RepID=A0A1W0E4B6_9MICR|nr:hypothetical protein EHP00_1790 [Ecytonucleospora hepatopenaei]
MQIKHNKFKKPSDYTYFFDCKEVLNELLSDQINYKYIYEITNKNLVSRKMLKILFEGALYKPCGSDKYRFKLIDLVLKRYKQMDDFLDNLSKENEDDIKQNFNNIEIFSNQINSDENKNEKNKKSLFLFDDKLFNTKYENTVEFYFKNLVEDSNYSTIDDNVLVLISNLFREFTNDENINTDCYDGLVSLFETAIFCSGNFLYRRMTEQCKLLNFLHENGFKYFLSDK